MTSTPEEKSEPAQPADNVPKPSSEFPWLFLTLFLLLTLLISFGLAVVFQTEDRSLSYLPRFIPSVVIAFLILKFSGMNFAKKSTGTTEKTSG